VRVRLTGEHLRPYLRAEIGGSQPSRFLIMTPTEGEIILPDLGPGTYDIALFDETEQVALAKNAITIAVPASEPTITMQLVGTFVNLAESAARSMKPGQRFPPQGDPIVEVVSTAPPIEDVRRVRTAATSVDVPIAGSWRVPATVRVHCVFSFDTQACALNGTPVTPAMVLSVSDSVRFVGEEVRADTPGVPIELLVRFVGRPEVLDAVKPGDADRLATGGGAARAARIASVVSRQTLSGETQLKVLGAPVEMTTQSPDRVAVVEALIRLAADPGPSGLTYRGNVLKPGALFTFESPAYVAYGSVIRGSALKVNDADR
jgi:hypothetical protein